ncbi:hypothetical protein IL306_011538 [Fusarium sp. DS 682]|nr:hypothetical protein IL306_011538 [Fusarium sp. DS 682]
MLSSSQHTPMLPDRRKAEKIRRWLVQAYEEAAAKERQAADALRNAQSESARLLQKDSELQEKERELESGKAALSQEHARVTQVAQTLPDQLSKKVTDASGAIKTMFDTSSQSTRSAIEAVGTAAKEVKEEVRATKESVAALATQSNLQDWAQAMEEQRLENMRSLMSQTMEGFLEKLKVKDSSDLALELEELRGKYNAKEQEVSKLQGEKEALEQEVQSLRASDREQSVALGGLRTEYDAKGQVVATLTKEKMALEQNVQSLRASDEEKSRKLTELKADFDAKEREVTRLQREKGELVESAESLRRDNVAFEEEANTLRSERAALEEQVQYVADLSGELRDAHRELDEAKRTIQVQTDRIKRRDDDIVLRRQFAETIRLENIAVRAAAQVDARHIEELTNRLGSADNERQDLIEARSSLRVCQDQLANVNSRLQEATDARLQLERARSSLEQGLIKATEDLKDRHDQITRLSEIHGKTEDALNEQLELCHKEVTEARSEIEELKGQLGAADADWRVKDAELSQCQDQVNTLQRELRNERGRLDMVKGFEEEISSMRSTLEDTQNLRQELSETKSLLKEAQEKVTTEEVTRQRRFASELAKTYSVLAEAFSDLPTAPGGNGSFRMDRVAIKIAPLLSTAGAKDNLKSFLSAQTRDWHCIEQVATLGPSHGYVGNGKCSKHPAGCVLLCVVSAGDQNRIAFREK